MSGGICIVSQTKKHQEVVSIVCIVEESGTIGFRGLAMR